MEHRLEPAPPEPSPWLASARGLAITAFALFAALLLGVALLQVAAAAGLPIATLGDASTPMTARTFAIAAALSSAALLAVAAGLSLRLRGPTPWRIPRGSAAATVAAAVVVFGLNFAGARIMEALGEPYALAGIFREGGARWPVLASAVLLAPIAEEWFFREILLVRAFAGAPRWLAVAVTSAAFGAMHVEAGALVLVTTLTAMGAVLAWVRLRTGSLGAAIAAHAANNLIVAILMLS